MDSPPAPRPAPTDLLDAVARRWLLVVTLAWALGAVWLTVARWNGIHWLSLADTDDNMRLSQVRAWLGGQSWYDLRNYRMDPPRGASIHWSRLVDLPIAGLILLGRLVTGPLDAERFAVAVAPLLPLWVSLLSLTLIVRRLIDRHALLLPLGLAFCAQSSLLMYMPTRIDHHGWQIALLLLALAGAVDFRGVRGGIVAGAAAAASLTIGLEMLPYIALTTGAIALRWVEIGRAHV